MNKLNANISGKVATQILLLFVCLIGIAAASLSSSSKLTPRYWTLEALSLREQTKAELGRLGLLKNISKDDLSKLFDYQCETGHSLATILRSPSWADKLNLKSNEFKGTWYAANPYELLPKELQNALKARCEPFKTRDQVWKWLKNNHFPNEWRKSLTKAFIETTPENLWRAAQGQRPYAKNGEYLEPIVYQKSLNEFVVRDGHIATDPRLIPTNSEVIVILKVQGEDRILRVKAADIGGGIRGKHVDLPIHLDATTTQPLPQIVFPSEIRNPTVTILSPLS